MTRTQYANDIALHLRRNVCATIHCRSTIADERLDNALKRMGGHIRRAPLGRTVRNLRIGAPSRSWNGSVPRTSRAITFDYLSHKNYVNDVDELIAGALKRLGVGSATFDVTNYGQRIAQRNCPCGCWEEE